MDKNIAKDELQEALRAILPEIMTPELMAEALKKIFTPNRVKAMSRGSLTVKQAALYKGVGEEKIRQKINSKELEITRAKGGIRILKSELDKLDFRKSGSVKTNPQSSLMSVRDRFQQKILEQAKLKNKK
jgi:excisionase family DNA binding protein